MKKLVRSRTDKMTAGICGGLGELLSVDPTLIRLAVVFIGLATAVLPILLAYLVGWAIIPIAPPQEEEHKKSVPPGGGGLGGGKRGPRHSRGNGPSVPPRVVAAMRADPVLRSFCGEPRLSTNRDLVFGWDTLSLFLCHGAAWLDYLELPADYHGRRVRVAVERRKEGWILDPYPFRTTPLVLSAAALRTERTRFAGESELREALASSTKAGLDLVIEAAED